MGNIKIGRYFILVYPVTYLKHLSQTSGAVGMPLSPSVISTDEPLDDFWHENPRLRRFGLPKS